MLTFIRIYGGMGNLSSKMARSHEVRRRDSPLSPEFILQKSMSFYGSKKVGWVTTWLIQSSSGDWSKAWSSEVRLWMGDLGGLISPLTSSSFRRVVKLGVHCLIAACTMGFKLLENVTSPCNDKWVGRNQHSSANKEKLWGESWV